MILPRLPRPGQKIDADWGARVVEYLRSITLRSGTNYRVKTTANGTSLDIGPSGRGGSVGTRPGPLQVSKARPPGTTDPDEETLYVWVWWGLVAEVEPSNIADPIVVPPGTDGTYYVYIDGVVAANVGSGISSNVLESCTIVCSKNKPVQPPPDAETGDPPSNVYYILATLNVSTVEGVRSVTRVNNTGSGSIGLYIYAGDYIVRAGTAGDPEADPPIAPRDAGITTLKTFTFFR